SVMSTVFDAVTRPLSAAVAVTSTVPSRWLTVSTPSLLMVALSVGEPSGSVTDQNAFFNVVSSGVNSAVKWVSPYGTSTESGPSIAISVAITGSFPADFDSEGGSRSTPQFLLGFGPSQSSRVPPSVSWSWWNHALFSGRPSSLARWMYSFSAELSWVTMRNSSPL